MLPGNLTLCLFIWLWPCLTFLICCLLILWKKDPARTSLSVLWYDVSKENIKSGLLLYYLLPAYNCPGCLTFWNVLTQPLNPCITAGAVYCSSCKWCNQLYIREIIRRLADHFAEHLYTRWYENEGFTFSSNTTLQQGWTLFSVCITQLFFWTKRSTLIYTLRILQPMELMSCFETITSFASSTFTSMNWFNLLQLQKSLQYVLPLSEMSCFPENFVNCAQLLLTFLPTSLFQVYCVLADLVFWSQLSINHRLCKNE